MSKLQKVQGLLNRLAAIRESWMDRRQEVTNVCGEVVGLFPEVIISPSAGYNAIFESLHNALSDELRFLTTYPAQAPSEERKVPVGSIPVGQRFFHENVLCSVLIQFEEIVDCLFVGNGRTFKMSPSVLVEPVAVDESDENADWPYLIMLGLGDRFLLDGFVYEVVERGKIFTCRMVGDESGTLAFFAWDTKVLRHSPGGHDIPVGSSEEPLLVPLDEIPDGMKFELGGMEVERCRLFSRFLVECKCAGWIGPIFFNLPASFSVRPISMPDTEKSSYEVDPADLILPAKPTGPAEVELCSLAYGDKFVLGGVKYEKGNHSFVDGVLCRCVTMDSCLLPAGSKVIPLHGDGPLNIDSRESVELGRLGFLAKFEVGGVEFEVENTGLLHGAVVCRHYVEHSSYSMLLPSHLKVTPK